MSLVDDLDSILPQTQCQDCSYPGCRPYAQALAQGQSSPDRCLPGGIPVLEALAARLGQDPSPYREAMGLKTKSSPLLQIREAECIGCTKCIQACPVDAVIGAAGQLHRIIGDECSGCGLCVPACPVDCIEAASDPRLRYQPTVARARFNAKQIRLLQAKAEQEQQYQEKRQLASKTEDKQADKQAKLAYIQAALARTQAKPKP